MFEPKDDKFSHLGPGVRQEVGRGQEVGRSERAEQTTRDERGVGPGFHQGVGGAETGLNQYQSQYQGASPVSEGAREPSRFSRLFSWVTREVYLFSLALTSIWTSLALLTFTSADPSILHTVIPDVVRKNWAGHMGAHVSAVLYYLFGTGAWMIFLPALFLTEQGQKLERFEKNRWWLSMATILFVVSSLSSIAQFSLFHPFTGGMLGRAGSWLTGTPLGTAGTVALYLTFLFLSVITLARVTLKTVAQTLWAYSRAGARIGYAQGVYWSKRGLLGGAYYIGVVASFMWKKTKQFFALTSTQLWGDSDMYGHQLESAEHEEVESTAEQVRQWAESGRDDQGEMDERLEQWGDRAVSEQSQESSQAPLWSDPVANQDDTGGDTDTDTAGEAIDWNNAAQARGEGEKEVEKSGWFAWMPKISMPEFKLPDFSRIFAKRDAESEEGVDLDPGIRQEPGSLDELAASGTTLGFSDNQEGAEAEDHDSEHVMSFSNADDTYDQKADDAEYAQLEAEEAEALAAMGVDSLDEGSEEDQAASGYNSEDQEGVDEVIRDAEDEYVHEQVMRADDDLGPGVRQEVAEEDLGSRLRGNDEGLRENDELLSESDDDDNERVMSFSNADDTYDQEADDAEYAQLEAEEAEALAAMGIDSLDEDSENVESDDLDPRIHGETGSRNKPGTTLGELAASGYNSEDHEEVDEVIREAEDEYVHEQVMSADVDAENERVMSFDAADELDEEAEYAQLEAEEAEALAAMGVDSLDEDSDAEDEYVHEQVMHADAESEDASTVFLEEAGETLPEKKPERKVYPPFELPDLEIFEPITENKEIAREEFIARCEERGKTLEEKLFHFGINGKVVAIKPGPVITLFEYEPDMTTKISKILSLEDDLALSLRALSIRIIAPVPGKNVVGFEIANEERAFVSVSEVLNDPSLRDKSLNLPLALGVDTAGNPVLADLAGMPHLLVAGATGSGKSVGMNTMLVSLLCAHSPDRMRLILIDPKRLEFAPYADIPHLLFPIITNPYEVSPVLKWVVNEMENRYNVMARAGVRNIADYHKLSEEKKEEVEEDIYPGMPYIVMMVDELADLMMVAGKEIEVLIARIAQMARAAGIHMIMATQRPSVDVVTGIIKVNFPSRIAFRVSTKIDSRTIIDGSGAEKLLGKGDMLYLSPRSSNLTRLHGPFVTDDEITLLTDYLKEQRDVDYLSLHQIVDQHSDSKKERLEDPLYNEIRQYIETVQEISISSLQRKYRVGFNRSARLIEMLERDGHIAPAQGSKPRRVLRHD